MGKAAGKVMAGGDVEDAAWEGLAVLGRRGRIGDRAISQSGTMAFSDIIGLEQPIRVLKRAILSERVSHAYLFCGPAGIGKTSVSYEFAKAVNCESRSHFASIEDVEPCDECSACERISKGIHPDVWVVRPTSRLESDEEGSDVVFEGSMITTDQVAHVVSQAALKANQARRKMFIITSAEAMNAEAANRLLKTLEEPPPGTTLILTTQNLSQLLPTIISRCQMVKFRSVATEQVVDGLQSLCPDADPELVRSVAAFSGGRVGKALRLLEHPEALTLRSRLLDRAAGLAGADWYEGMGIAEEFIGTAEEWWLATEEEEFAEKALKASRDRVLRTKMNEVLDVLLTWFRDLAVMCTGGSRDLIINSDRFEELEEAADGRRPDWVRKACWDIEETREQLRGNANLRLSCEVLAFKLIRACR